MNFNLDRRLIENLYFPPLNEVINNYCWLTKPFFTATNTKVTTTKLSSEEKITDCKQISNQLFISNDLKNITESTSWIFYCSLKCLSQSCRLFFWSLWCDLWAKRKKECHLVQHTNKQTNIHFFTVQNNCKLWSTMWALHQHDNATHYFLIVTRRYLH